MDATYTNLQPVIEGTKQYVIPLFQRPYSWDRREWDALWQDLLDLAEEGGTRKHFLGSIVTMPAHSVPAGVSKFLLIDGQQRLTTLLIILAVLRDMAAAEPGTLAQQIDELLLRNRFHTGTEAYKLLPTQGDREAFAAIMQNGAADSSQLLSPLNESSDVARSQMLKAYRFFRQKAKISTSPNTESLQAIIIQQLSIVSIVLEAGDNPHLIFESLNARGRPLAQADLIRNYFLMRIHMERQSVVYDHHWRPMQDLLGQNLTEFIRHFLMRDGEVIRQSDVYLAIKQQVDDLSEDEVVSYLKHMASFAMHYSRLLDPSLEQHPHISERLSALNRIEVTTAYPLLLNLYDDYASHALSDDDYVSILLALENYLVRRFVCSIPTYGLNKVLPLVYSQASVYPSLADGVRAVLSARRYPSDEEFHDRLVNGALYGPGERIDKTKLILERLELSYQHREPVDFDQLSIEHVMPQTLSDEWKEYLGEDWPSTYSSLRDNIGNLTLTGYNSSMSNDSYQKKRLVLSASHVELNSYFATHPDWREDDIRKRSEELARRSIQVWPYFGTPGKGYPDAGESIMGKVPKEVTIVGQPIPVQSWRDVMQATLNAISALDSVGMSIVVHSFPHVIGPDPSAFRTSRTLENGLFMETNLSASRIYRFCRQAVECAGLTEGDWVVAFE